MVRNGKKARRLVVDGKTFLWSVRHEHRVEQTGELPSRYRDCREVVSLRLYGMAGRVLIEFSANDGRFVSDGMLPGGTVGADGGRLNLNEPGTVRALLDEVLAQGWSPTAVTTEHLDGWQFFEAVVERRRVR